MRLVAISAIFKDGRMLPQERTPSLCMASVAVLIDAVLFEHGGVGAAMGVVTVRADNFTFPHGHVRRTHELGFSLQMTLAADFNLRSLDKERRHIGELGQLLSARLFHNRVAIDTRHAATLVRAGVPVGLNAALMAG